ncbi:hypothetical protein KL866_10095 [Alteromonas sp. ALT199]|uniref:hypothetical protein n=1 Tax=unclassified Alteromonas TaxID=2614992 RepID=UPI001BEB1DE1|nr:hypothetical protein [Alteromonas sp. ALT199]MBT3135451.1 hypothetical protein [Alteromonas sp. ALT199]
MAVRIAEYLGQRTDCDAKVIEPIALGTDALCPFMDKPCSKVSKKRRANHPVCSVRKPNDEIWIVCEHRLCSTSNTKKVTLPERNRKGEPKTKAVKIGLVAHQIDILKKIAKTIYREPIDFSKVMVKRETLVPLPEAENAYHADYIMRNLSPGAKVDEILLEMQGGGETNNTGSITTHIDNWAANPYRTNEDLRKSVNAGTLETNAWRRQQEQFLVKGNVVDQTGGKIVFAVGSELYDYLEKRFRNAGLRDLRAHNWTLCILAFKEQKVSPIPGPIPLEIDSNKVIFSNYSTFVRFLTDQGGPEPSIFEGDFITLDNKPYHVDASLP